MDDPRVIVALDFAQAEQAIAFAQKLDPSLCRLKVGKELFVATGPSLIEKLQALNFEVFLDLKFHDIPNTVANVCKVAADLGVWMINVHASGGEKMMAAAADVMAHYMQPPLLIAVTVLTSMDEQQFSQLNYTTSIEQQVQHLALMTQQAGLNGVVCSSREAPVLRKIMDRDFLLVTPGIRPSGDSHDDQSRIMTPRQAMDAGSDYLVIGRPIRLAQDPLAKLQEINAQMC